MPSTKELKDRINAVQETKKITNAMYLISSTKLRRAKADLAQTRPYFDALRAEIARMLQVDNGFQSRYFLSADGTPPDGACGILVITADKGLAGAYNMNVIREAEKLYREKKDARIFVVGEVGRRYFAAHKYAMTFLGGAHSPSMDGARAICTALLDSYDGGGLGELAIVYTDMKNSLASSALTHRLLPLERHHFEAHAPEGNGERQLEFVPSVEEVVRGVMRSYLSGFIYSALLDSFCSEQNARVAAMDAANVNAQELLGDLSLQLNRQRQAAITQEITEISAGAQAQKNKKKV